MALDKFLDLIITQKLFFTNAKRMTDKYEGTVPKRNRQHYKRSLKEEGYSLHEANSEANSRYWMVESMRAYTLLNCWTMSKNESYALWKIYLDGAKAGVAIKSTVSKLIRSIESGADPLDEKIYISKVNYSDYIKNPDSRFEVTITKNKFYDYEKELRLFIFNFPESEGGSSEEYEVEIGRTVDIDAIELIDEIYLSPFVGPWFQNSFKETIDRVEPKFSKKIKSSEILDQ